MKYDCGSCKWFKNPRSGKKSCRDKGKTKWSDPCNSWTPKEELGELFDSFQQLVLSIPEEQRAIADWMLQKVMRTDVLESKTGYKTGEKIAVYLENRWVKARIKTILSTAEVIGCLRDGREFQVPFGSIRKRSDRKKIVPVMKNQWACTSCGHVSLDLTQSHCVACQKIRPIVAACTMPGQTASTAGMPLSEVQAPLVGDGKAERVRRKKSEVKS